MLIANNKNLELVGHKVTWIVTLVTDRVGWRYTSLHVIPQLTERSLGNYRSVILLLLVLTRKNRRMHEDVQALREDPTIEVRDSELENIRLPVSLRCYHWPYNLRWICLLSQGQMLRPGKPPPLARITWHPVFDSPFPHRDLHIMNSNLGLVRCHLPRSLIVAPKIVLQWLYPCQILNPDMKKC